MRTLILSCSTGGGHNSCAAAIKEIYDENEVYCTIKDVLGFITEGTPEFFSRWHSNIYRYMPWLFSFGYGYCERHEWVFDDGSLVRRYFSRAVKKLYRFIRRERIDSVICTHIFAAFIVTDMKKRYGIRLKTAFVATDYACHPGTGKAELDHWFIPHHKLTDEFADNEVPETRIISTGIPVSQSFYRNIPKSTAAKRMGVSPKRRHLVISCGSMGCGPIKKILQLLTQYEQDVFDISVVCGTNRKLYNRLKEGYREAHNIHILGYVKNMPLLLDSADLLLAKPGGITTTEAFVKRLPMVFINAVAGCEEYNRRWFESMGAAVSADDAAQAAELCVALMTDKDRLHKMKNSISQQPRHNAAEIIYHYMQLQGDAQNEEIHQA